MDNCAIRTIRIHRWTWSRAQAMKLAQSFLDKIQAKYPEGLDNTTYFVLPTFEHVTRCQPIAVFNPLEGIWELSNTTLFECNALATEQDEELETITN